MRSSAHLVAIALAASAFTSPGGASTQEPVVVRVTDGDTFSILGPDGVVIVRPIGFDTAETHRCRCNRECALGARATEVLADVLSPPATIDIQFTGRKSWDRALAHVFVDGRDLGDVMEERIPDAVHRGNTRKPGGWCG